MDTPVKQRLIVALEYRDGTMYMYGWARSVQVSGPYLDTSITWAGRPKESRHFPTDADFDSTLDVQEALDG